MSCLEIRYQLLKYNLSIQVTFEHVSMKIEIMKTLKQRILSHGNKKTLGPFYHKNFLIENECKTPYGCLTFIFSQKYDKMDLKTFILA